MIHTLLLSIQSLSGLSWPILHLAADRELCQHGARFQVRVTSSSSLSLSLFYFSAVINPTANKALTALLVYLLGGRRLVYLKDVNPWCLSRSQPKWKDGWGNIMGTNVKMDVSGNVLRALCRYKSLVIKLCWKRLIMKLGLFSECSKDPGAGDYSPSTSYLASKLVFHHFLTHSLAALLDTRWHVRSTWQHHTAAADLSLTHLIPALHNQILRLWKRLHTELCEMARYPAVKTQLFGSKNFLRMLPCNVLLMFSVGSFYLVTKEHPIYNIT